MIEIRKLTIEARITSESKGQPTGLPAAGGHLNYFDPHQQISEIVQRVIEQLKDQQENR
ncbi:DUF5908 family protein [Rouxiella sp. WC2420]|uniref:DUF5908 family protein n=1 Tax=Rouxiella sp. WC2420 TaxID=3234145 RepID=A0AB39VUY6_9GAMM